MCDVDAGGGARAGVGGAAPATTVHSIHHHHQHNLNLCMYTCNKRSCTCAGQLDGEGERRPLWSPLTQEVSNVLTRGDLKRLAQLRSLACCTKSHFKKEAIASCNRPVTGPPHPFPAAALAAAASSPADPPTCWPSTDRTPATTHLVELKNTCTIHNRHTEPSVTRRHSLPALPSIPTDISRQHGSTQCPPPRPRAARRAKPGLRPRSAARGQQRPRQSPGESPRRETCARTRTKKTRIPP